MENIKVNSTYIEYETGVWFYAGELLKIHGLNNNGTNKYKLVMWLERENLKKILNHRIGAKTYIMIPADKTDVFNICLFKLTLNEKGERIINNSYSINFLDIQIFKSKKQPRFDEAGKEMLDIKCGDESDEIIIKYDSSFKETIHNFNKKFKFENYMDSFAFRRYKNDELIHIGEMRNLIQLCSFLDSGMQVENEALLNHFIQGTGKDYYSETLSTKVRNNSDTKRYINFAIEKITKSIKEYHGDILQLEKDDNINKIFQKNAVFPRFENPFNGLMIAIHVTHGNNIYIENASIKNNVFRCNLKFDIFDHYGLNFEDLQNNRKGIKFVSLAGFRAWYYLQHSENYGKSFKPFVTHAIFTEKLEIQL